MFICTAQMIKPMNPDDLPRMRGVDGLKSGSPLGVEPKGEGINGRSGYSIGGEAKPEGSSQAAPAQTEKKTDASSTPTVQTAVAEVPASTKPSTTKVP
jgi:hypothetical protein